MTRTDLQRFFSQLSAAFTEFGGTIHVVEDSATPWASGSFIGTRRVLSIDLEGLGAGRAADAFLRDLDEREFRLPRHVVADIGLLDDVRYDDDARLRLRLEALLVEAD